MATEKSEQFVLLNHLADEFAERYRQGERPSLQEYVDRHPALADGIREFFPALVEMEQVKEARAQVGEPKPTGPLPPLERLGDYRIIREIGHGGMGVVYEAEQISLGRRVALKVMTQRVLRNADFKRRFEREAKAAAKLHHTNIVPVFGTGEHEGTPYYVMQFIQGTGLDVVIRELAQMNSGVKSLTSYPPGAPVARKEASAIAKSLCTGVHYLANNGGLDATCDLGDVEESPPDLGSASSRVANSDGPSRLSSSCLKLAVPGGASSSGAGRRLTFAHSVARVGLQVADALEHAHKQGIVHRDIKPSNLLLDLAGTVWVTDFGLAKADDSEDLTHSGDILGTIRYVPPEAFDAKSDARGDVYSLGLTLYELLAGRPAFAESDRNKLIKLVSTSEPVRLDRLCPKTPRDLVTVIHKAIEREPGARYQKAQDLAEDLRRFLEDRSIRARRATPWERMQRWARRNRAAAFSLAGVVAIFLTAFVLVSWSYFRAERARRLAEQREKDERWERYRANLIAVGSAMQLHNVSAAQNALDAAPEEHRNWEWKYFQHQFDTSQHVIRFDDIRQMRVSPDGALAAVQPGGGPARLWDLGTRQEIGSLHNPTPARYFLFSPDSRILAYSAGDQIVLWDIPAQRERAALNFPRAWLQLSQFSPNGTRLVGVSADNIIRVWDTATGKPVTDLRGHAGEVKLAVFSPDGRRIASTGLTERIVRLWDAETGQSQGILGGHEFEVGQGIFNPQGDRVLSLELYPSNALRLWDAATGKLLTVMRGHTNGAETLAFSPDGSRIVSGGLDRSIRVWDGRTGQALWSREGHRGAIQSVAFSPDGKYVISGSLDQTARLWDAATGTPLGVLHGHTGAIHLGSACYTQDGGTIVTASVGDGTVRLWDARRAEWNSSLRGHESFVYSVAFHPDGKRVASAAWDGTVRVWDATTGRQLSELHYPIPRASNNSIVSSVAFHPTENLVASFARDGAIRFWDLTTNQPVAQEAFRLQLPTDTVYDHSSDARFAFSSRGNLVAVPGGHDNSVHVWDVGRRTVAAVLRGHSSHVLESCFSPDDSWLATAGDDRTVRIWDMATQQQVQVLEGHTSQVHTVAVSRDGKRLASGSRDGTVRLWDTTTWKQAAVLKHGTIVYGVAFSPDGTRLASACANNMIRFWDMTTHQLVAELDGHAAYVHQIAFSPDGTRLVSGSGDFTVRIWDSLSVQERAGRAEDAAHP